MRRRSNDTGEQCSFVDRHRQEAERGAGRDAAARHCVGGAQRQRADGDATRCAGAQFGRQLRAQLRHCLIVSHRHGILQFFFVGTFLQFFR